MNPKVYAAAAVIASQYAGFNPKEVEQFVGGLVFGFIQKDDLTNIETCMKDTDVVAKEMTEAIQDFAKKDLTDIVKGVQILGEIAEGLGSDLGDCEAMSADVNRIEKWAQIFANPKELVPKLVTNVLKNYAAIIADASDASTQIAAKDLYKTGQDAADILVMVVGPVPQTNDDIVMTQW